MVPMHPASRTLAFIASFLALASLAPPAASEGDACRDQPPGEYVSGEIGEYVTGAIPEFITEAIPEYVTGEIPEYAPRGDGWSIPADYPPAVRGSAYVEIRPGVFILMRGSHGRRYARFARLVGGFDGDRLITYLEHGFPRHRHRENDQDVVTEHWTYPESHITFVFCGDRLVRTNFF